MIKKPVTAKKKPRSPASNPKDSHNLFLADVMKAVNNSLSQMPEKDRAGAVAEIHTIAEAVRMRQARSTGRRAPSREVNPGLSLRGAARS